MILPTPQDYQRVPETTRHPRTRRWVVFRCIPQLDGSVSKVPYHPSGFKASINKPHTWSSFDECIEALKFDIGNALGFALGKDYKLLCVDLDGCIQPDGTISATARRYLAGFKTYDPYIERSISGTGIHILTWYTGKPLPPDPEPGVELYTQDRFIVLTGVPL